MLQLFKREELREGPVSGGYSGFSVDLERACGGQGEEGSQFAVGLWEGVRGEVGSETQGGPLATVAIVRPTVSFAFLVWWPGC